MKGSEDTEKVSRKREQRSSLEKYLFVVVIRAENERVFKVQ